MQGDIFMKDAVGSKPVYDYKIERHVKIPMRDGVNLSANIFLPRAEGKFPAILVRSAYGKGDGTFWAKHGYAFITQDVRGRFDSEGEWYPFIHEAKDGYDTLEWIGHQPWCNGKVGMVGASYLAAVQWLVAPERSPYLKALIPLVMAGDYWKHAYWCDGAFSLALTATWLCMETPTRTTHSALLPAYDWQKIFRTLPLITFDEATGYSGQITFYRDYVKHYTITGNIHPTSYCQSSHKGRIKNMKEKIKQNLSKSLIALCFMMLIASKWRIL